MNHKEKLKLARKLSPPRKNKTYFKGMANKGPFESPEWEARKARIAARVEHKEQVAMQRKIERNLQNAE